jgi:hypothetical protein
VSAPVTKPARLTPALTEAVEGELSGIGGLGSAAAIKMQAVMPLSTGSGKDGSAEAAIHPARVAIDARAKSPHRTPTIPHAVATTDTSRLRHNRVGTPTAEPSHKRRNGPQTTLSPAPTAT